MVLYLSQITTPNSDFNTVFNLAPGKFRHWDHKFEWSRREFVDWCNHIVGRFPEYSYSIHGIGHGPPETEPLGCVSQMAIFKKSTNVPCSTVFSVQAPCIRQGMDNGYKLLESIEYPNYVETRSVEEIIICDVDYLMTHCWVTKKNIEYFMELNRQEFIIPLTDVLSILAAGRSASAANLKLEYLQ